MKVLYIGRERHDAQAVATALRGIAQNGAVSWTSRLDSAVSWIDQNSDVGALVVGPDVDLTGWRPLLDHARDQPSHPVVVVIRSENAGPEVDSHAADEVLTQSGAWSRDLPAALDRARSRQQSTQAAERQAQLQAAVELERSAREAVEQQLAEARAAVHAAEEHCRAAIAHATEQLARQQAQYEIGMARAAVTWDMVDEQLREAAVNVARCRRDQASAEATVERLARRETELSSLLAEARADHVDLERRLADAESALEAASTRAEHETREAASRLAECRRDFETRLTHEIEARNAVEQTLARARDDHAAAEIRSASALDDLAARSRQLEEALREARRDIAVHTADLDRRTAREAELTSALDDAAVRRADVERRLAATEAAFEDAAARATRELLAAASRAAEREAELDAEIQQGRAARARAEQVIAERDTALADVQQRLEAALTAAAQERAEAAGVIERLTEHESALSSQLCKVEAHRDGIARRLAEADAAIHDAAERETALQIDIERERTARSNLQQIVADGDAALAVMRSERDAARAEVARLTRREAELVTHIAHLEAARDSFELRLTAATGAMADAERHAASERAAAADRQSDLEARLREALETRDTLQRTLTEVRSAAIDVERSLNDEIDALRQSVVEGEERFGRMSRDHSAALAARDQEIEQLQAQIAAANLSLEAAERRVEALQPEADRVPDLLAHLEASRSESARRFAQAPVGMFRCTPDGTLIEANRAWAALVRRRPDDLPGADCAAAFLESPGDLGWLFDRCVSSRTKESMETTVRRDDGARLYVRLSAYASSTNVIECVAEDLTRPRILEDRLARAGRMEAVGRLAAEVATTCGTLLGDIRRDAEQWLLHANGSEYRRRAEMIVDDLNRAAGHLQQLVAYGEKQTGAPAPVDLQTVVRDLVPALKHLAGDDVDVRVLARSAPLTVDVDRERVEGLLVNLVACGRDRMPFGGCLTIEVGTSTVDRQFAARYPNVRPGPHALITVTEARRSAPRSELLQLRDAQPAARGPAGRKSTVHLATLQGLVGECGGHLWMKVPPAGDLVAKIRLPLVVSYGHSHPPALAASDGRGGTIARWFRH